MDKVVFGKTGLMVTRSGFGALPVQRLTKPDGAALLRRAFDGGINFFDTANGYSDSEEKIGLGLSDVRSQIIIATKTGSSTPDVFWRHLNLSLERMKTDYIDIYQFHNPRALPGEEMLECMRDAKAKGLIRHAGITCHRLDNAIAAARSGNYETIQYPLSALSSREEISFVELCASLDIGVIGMKGLAGGLLTSAAPTMAFLRPYANVVPIWGFQRDCEVDEVIALERNPPALDEAMLSRIESDREQLSGNYCRGCGYCMPCPSGIEINTCARMPLLLRRSPSANWITPRWREEMEKITRCIRCGKCVKACPYSLDTPQILAESLEDYKAFVSA
ncbi:MAG: aldo/keto reductase [Oscillospiraceae bacterium]|nr:aldo/keto reductase [Oscillospiraceae bacterium]